MSATRQIRRIPTSFPARTEPAPIPPGWPLLLGGICVASVVLVQQIVQTRVGRSLDHAMLGRVLDLVGGATGTAQMVLSATTNLSVLAALVVLIAVAVLRQRPDLAVAAAAIVLGSSATTAIIKAVLGGSLPSGHVTAAAGLACAAVVVASRWLRPLIVVLGVTATAIQATSTMILGWHLPSDVAAAGLVAVGWTALVHVTARISR